MQLVIDDLVGSTGLELKVDPGVPYVYAGFAGAVAQPHLHCLCSSKSDCLLSCSWHLTMTAVCCAIWNRDEIQTVHVFCSSTIEHW